MQKAARKVNLVIDECRLIWANIHDLQKRVKELENDALYRQKR